MNEEQKSIDNGRIMKKMMQDLGSKFGEELAKKIGERIARRLGYATVANILGGAIPGKKIADAATAGFKYMYFEAKLNAFQFTPYHPVKYEDQYIEFLIYSWARTGKPHYIPDPILYPAEPALSH